MILSWITDDQKRAEQYLNNLQPEGSSDEIKWDAQDQNNPLVKGDTGEKRSIERNSKEKKSLNKSARAGRVIEAYSEKFEKIRDLIIPLIDRQVKNGMPNKICKGLLRINCIYREEGLNSLQKLKESVKQLENEFNIIANFVSFLQKRPENKEIYSYHEMDKIGRELEITFVDLIIIYLTEINNNGLKDLKQFFSIVEDVIETYSQDLPIQGIKNELKNKTTKVMKKLPRIRVKLQGFQEIIIAMSVWLNREHNEDDLIDDLILREDPYIYIREDNNLKRGYILDYSSNNAIDNIKQEFFRISTFEAEKKFIRHLIYKMQISQKKIISQPLVNKEGNYDYELDLDGMTYGSILARKTGFKFLHIAKNQQDNKEYISIYSEAEIKEDQIKILSGLEGSFTEFDDFQKGIYLRCIWTRQPHQQPVVFKCKDGKIKNLFFNPQNNYRIPALSLENYNLDSKKHSIYRILNDEEKGLYFLELNPYGKDAEKTYYQNLLDNLVEEHNDTLSSYPCINLIDAIGLRFVFCQPIFVDNDLRTVMFLYSLYTDPSNEDISIFMGKLGKTSRDFISATAGFLRQQITLLDIERKERKAKMLLSITAHDINRHVMPKIKVDEGKIKKYLRDKLHYFSIVTKKIDVEDIDKCNIKDLIQEFGTLDLSMGIDWRKVNIVGDNPNIYTIKIAFFSLLENIITNSFRHSGKKQETEVTINIEKSNDKIGIFFCDNGAGFDINAINNLERWSNGNLTEEEFKNDDGTGIFAIKSAVNLLRAKIMWPDKINQNRIIVEFIPNEWEPLFSKKQKSKEVRPPGLRTRRRG